ncbi:Feruloyl esterase B [Fusarium oxysporum f. sp. albedinis]|nr:Feruloyl esterase B [Fusarium oxysporum f. sp. albedinis]
MPLRHSLDSPRLLIVNKQARPGRFYESRYRIVENNSANITNGGEDTSDIRASRQLIAGHFVAGHDDGDATPRRIASNGIRLAFFKRSYIRQCESSATDRDANGHGASRARVIRRVE